MEPSETNELWKRFIIGDSNALSLIYNRYIHELYSYGLKIYSDEQLVKDCIQEVFIQLIHNRKNLKPTETTYLYLFKSLRNKLLEEIRSKNRQCSIIHFISQDISSHEISREQSKVQMEEKEERMLDMAKALDSLTAHQLEAIFLKYSQGLNYEKIAELLDLDVASARTLIFRSLKKIKENLPVKHQILFYIFHSFKKKPL